MNPQKYIGMDVHQATISVAVMDSKGRLIMECLEMSPRSCGAQTACQESSRPGKNVTAVVNIDHLVAGFPLIMLQ